MIKLLVTLVLAGAVLVGVVILGGIVLLAGRLFKGGRHGLDDRQETESAQELYRQLEVLEGRVENLETIIISGRRGEPGERT